MSNNQWSVEFTRQLLSIVLRADPAQDRAVIFRILNGLLAALARDPFSSDLRLRYVYENSTRTTYVLMSGNLRVFFPHRLLTPDGYIEVRKLVYSELSMTQMQNDEPVPPFALASTVDEELELLLDSSGIQLENFGWVEDIDLENLEEASDFEYEEPEF